MIYISIDTETTGIDKEKCQVIELGAIIEDTTKPLSFEESPKFECIVEWPDYTGSAFAINMNQRIFDILARASNDDVRKEFNILKHYEVTEAFTAFLIKNGFEDTFRRGRTTVINAAGKNFARFDWDFLYKLPKWSSNIQFSQRVIDPAILCTDWNTDLRIPNSNDCKVRCGLDGIVSHKAIEDAWDVIQVIRKKTNNYGIV